MYPLLHHHRVYFTFGNPCCIITTQNENQNQRCAGVSAWLRRKSTLVAVLPTRDRVIDFGKYKGKMLGSLPSSYLRWVSKNLRAREFEEWANLADEVLRDPIYRDRIEWEFALNVLNGNTSSSRVRPTGGAVSALRDISERFGWDNLDKVGWSKVDFDLLGTSKGGRIPRLADLNLTDTDAQPKQTPTPAVLSPSPGTVSRRMERRERQKMKLRRTQAQQQKNDVVADEDTIHVKEDRDNYNIAIANPFPGRQALLQLKARNHRTST